MIDDIFARGLQGIQSGLSSAARYAQDASDAFGPNGDGDLAGPAIGLKLSELQVAASVKVIKTGDELNKSVLDILA